MRELHTAAATYFDALPDARREEATASVLKGETTFATTKLRMADPDLDRRLGHAVVELLATRLGVDVECTKCHATPARLRDDYEWGPLCDRCAATTAVWRCPECHCTIDGYVDRAGDTCSSCKARPDWEALPLSIRDEVGAVADASGVVEAMYRLMQLDGNRRPNREYMLMAAYRASLPGGARSRLSREG
jgi:hypothetical protein